MNYQKYIMERKSCFVAKESFIERKLVYEDFRQNMVPCMVRYKVCWGKILLFGRQTHS